LHVLSLAAVAAVLAVPSCGGSPGSDFGGSNGGSQSDDGGGGSNGNGQGNFGGSTSDGGVESCTPPGSTRTCCITGTQVCVGNGENAAWGPCKDSSGKALTCSGTGGGGAEDSGTSHPDSGGPGNGGNGSEPPPPACNDPTVNTEPNILVGYVPANGQSVGNNGQIKVWVNDERAPFVAPGEQIDPTTGAITMAGDRTAKAPDNYLWEPTLYINGHAFFPTAIKGPYNNHPPTYQGASYPTDAPIDPVPPGAIAFQTYTGEDVWDVSSLGLSPGTYAAEFVVHDGDRERAVGCISIVIQ